MIVCSARRCGSSAADERKAQVQKVLDFFQPPAAPGAPK
jgi:hypothetical protein